MYTKRRQSKVFVGYMVYIISLIVCPFILLDVIFLVNGLRQVETAYAASQEYAMRQAVDGMDNDFQTFRNVVAQLSTDSDITPYLLQSKSYDSVTALRKLQIYQAQMNFFDELYLYISGDETLYSGSGIISLANFKGKLYSFEEEGDEERFDAYMARAGSFALSLDGNGGVLHKRREGGRYIAVTYPWLNSAIHPLGAAVGLVKEEYFPDRLRIGDEEYDQGVYLFSRDGKLQFKAENGLELSGEDTDDLWDYCRSSGIAPGRVMGKRCYLITQHSSVTGWYYVAVIPRSQFLFKYVYSQNRVVGLITLILLACILAGVAAALRMYRPVQELWSLLEPSDRKSSRKPQEKNRDCRAVDEWESLRTSVAGIVKKNRDIMKELDDTKVQRQKSLLKGLLLGNVNLDTVEESLNRYEIYFEEDFFCVIVLYSLKPLLSGQQKGVMELMAGLKIPGLYQVLMDENGSLALLWNTPAWSEENQILLEELYQKISGGETEGWVVGVSGSYPSVTSISRSYMEALAAGEGMQLKGRAGIFYYAAFEKDQEHNELYIIEAEVRLRQSLLADNGAMALAAMDQLESALVSNWRFENFSSRKFVLFHIIQGIVPIGERAGVPYLNEKVEEWARYRNLGEFLSGMRKFCQEILECGQKAKDEKVNELYQKLLDYIEEYYDDSSISLGEMAERFGMSPSYLSRFFRKYSGKNFLEYVTEKRIERVCYLLKNTDLKVKTIVEQVGYLDVASFTKKFRKIMGVSPARYREMARQERKEDKG